MSSTNSINKCRATKEKLSEEVEEAARDLEVSENDKTVLKDSLASAEAEKNGLALDLGEVTKVSRALFSLVQFYLIRTWPDLNWSIRSL